MEIMELQLFLLNSYLTTIPYRFVYRKADISALSRSLYSAEMYVSCSVQKCEWHSIFLKSQFSNMNFDAGCIN